MANLFQIYSSQGPHWEEEYSANECLKLFGLGEKFWTCFSLIKLRQPAICFPHYKCFINLRETLQNVSISFDCITWALSKRGSKRSRTAFSTLSASCVGEAPSDLFKQTKKKVMMHFSENLMWQKNINPL